jgi:hypothetical protein
MKEKYLLKSPSISKLSLKNKKKRTLEVFLNEKSKKKTLTTSPIRNSKVQEAIQEVPFLKKEKNK